MSTLSDARDEMHVCGVNDQTRTLDGGPSFTVTRRTYSIVWNFINGIYVVHSENHEKPVYKKKGAGDLLTSY